jgi:hypothetical protein
MMTPHAPQPEPSRIALLALIAANLIPVFGVFYWDWSVFTIVFLYWCENLIVGLITILKMLTARPDPEQGGFVIELPDAPGRQAKQLPLPAEAMSGAAAFAVNLFLIPFFAFHYGMFCMGHGIFVFSLFGGDSPGNGIWQSAAALLEGPLLLVCAALLVSHLISYAINYLGHGENRRTNPVNLMMAPYKRIVVLHLTIIFGGWMIMAFDSPLGLLLLMIGLKIFMDVRAHLQERRRFGPARASASAAPPMAISAKTG